MGNGSSLSGDRAPHPPEGSPTYPVRPGGLEAAQSAKAPAAAGRGGKQMAAPPRNRGALPPVTGGARSSINTTGRNSVALPRPNGSQPARQLPDPASPLSAAGGASRARSRATSTTKGAGPLPALTRPGSKAPHATPISPTPSPPPLGLQSGGPSAFNVGRLVSPLAAPGGQARRSSFFLSPPEAGTDSGRGAPAQSGGEGREAAVNASLGDGIVSVATPSGMGDWSSSSSSFTQASLRGHSNAGGAGVGRPLVGGTDARPQPSSSASPRMDSATSGPFDDRLTPELMPLTGGQLHSFDLNDVDGYDLNSNGAASEEEEDGEAAQKESGRSGLMRRGLGVDKESSRTGLATFFNRPKECHGCQSPAVAYGCDQCTSFFLCEDCRFNEEVLAQHNPAHRISPLHETHCNSSRVFGGSSSLLTVDGVSSLFYDPCSSCSRVIDDSEPVYRCETCDFILCDNCHSLQTVVHQHELRRFQRRTRNGSVTEGTLFSKSRTNDGNRIINDYVVVRLLGQGSYAKVKLVQNIRTRQLYALKILRKSRRSQSNLLNRSRVRQNDDDLLREIAVMKFVNHTNIVKLAEVIDDVEAGKLYVIMEYCAKGPVHVAGSPPLGMEEVRNRGLGILSGLLHLHSEFLYHRDVKPANCLVDDQDIVKIADFGTCNSRIRTSGIDGTPAFTSPEQIRGEEVSGEVADSWAFALTLYQMAYGSLPCDGMATYGYREFLARPDPIPIPPATAVERAAALQRERPPGATGPLPPPCAAVADAALTDLLTRMLAKRGAERMLLSAAAYHPFFRLSKAEAQQLCRPSASLDASATGARRTSGGGSARVAGSPTVRITASPSSPPGGVGRRRRCSDPLRGPTAQARPSPTKGATTAATAHEASPTHALEVFSPHTGSASSRFSNLYERALLEVRRGKNLTEAFYGVKSLRQVHRKDVKNSEHDVEEAEDVGSASLAELDSGANIASSSNGLSAGAGSGAGSPAGRRVSSGGRGPIMTTATTPKRPTRTPPLGGPIGRSLRPHSGTPSTSLSASGLPHQVRLSHSSLPDVTFDLASIVDQVTQQKMAGTGTLELVRLNMRSVPAVVNDVADITVSLRFSLNHLLSVASVKFSQFALLKDITITSNQLRRFPEEVLKAPRLLRLDLSHNNITTIPPTLAKARFLERLNLHSNNIKEVPVDARTKVSVLGAPSLRHVRLSSNPLEGLPRGLEESPQGIELVLDANPALMREWCDLVHRVSAQGRAPAAVVVWDDYYPVRVAGTAYEVWIASGDLSLYRAHTLRMCGAPFVVLFSEADSRFPSGGAFTSAQLTEYLQASNADPRYGPGGGSGNPSATQRLSRSGVGGAEGEGGACHAIPPPPPRPLPPIISRESRGFAQSYFFVSNDVEDEKGGYHALFDFFVGTLTRQESALLAKKITPPRLATGAAVADGKKRGTPTAGPRGRRGSLDSVSIEELGVEQPRTGNGLMVFPMSSLATKDARELVIAALADALCKMSQGVTEEHLKIHYDAVMDATRSLYA